MAILVVGDDAEEGARWVRPRDVARVVVIHGPHRLDYLPVSLECPTAPEADGRSHLVDRFPVSDTCR